MFTYNVIDTLKSSTLASSGITANTLGLSFVRQTGMVENLCKEAISNVLEHTILKS
jgi:hypothetical protein